MSRSRKCFYESYYYLADTEKCPPSSVFAWDGEDAVSDSIPVYVFPSHVTQLHADGDIGFSKEYEALQICYPQDDLTSSLSQHPDNKPKNRYMNILSCKSWPRAVTLTILASYR